MGINGAIQKFNTGTIYRARTRTRIIRRNDELIVSGFGYIIKNKSETNTLIIQDVWEIEPGMVDSVPDCSMPVYYREQIEFYWVNEAGERVYDDADYLLLREAINPDIELNCKTNC